MGAAAAPAPSRRKASLLPVKKGASGRQSFAVVESEHAEKAPRGDGVGDVATAKGRGSVGPIVELERRAA